MQSLFTSHTASCSPACWLLYRSGTRTRISSGTLPRPFTSSLCRALSSVQPSSQPAGTSFARSASVSSLLLSGSTTACSASHQSSNADRPGCPFLQSGNSRSSCLCARAGGLTSPARGMGGGLAATGGLNWAARRVFSVISAPPIDSPRPSSWLASSISSTGTISRSALYISSAISFGFMLGTSPAWSNCSTIPRTTSGSSGPAHCARAGHN